MKKEKETEVTGLQTRSSQTSVAPSLAILDKLRESTAALEGEMGEPQEATVAPRQPPREPMCLCCAVQRASQFQCAPKLSRAMQLRHSQCLS